MEIYKIWTKIKTVIGNFDWIITEIRIMWNNDVSYCVSYEENWIKNMYFYDYELIIGDAEKQIIWFKI